MAPPVVDMSANRTADAALKLKVRQSEKPEKSRKFPPSPLYFAAQ